MSDEQARSRLLVGLARVAKSPLQDFASKAFRWRCGVVALTALAVAAAQVTGHVARPARSIRNMTLRNVTNGINRGCARAGLEKIPIQSRSCSRTSLTGKKERNISMGSSSF